MTDTVPELTRNTAIQLNRRVSLQLLAALISFADDARTGLESCLCGRVGCRGGSLVVVSRSFL